MKSSSKTPALRQSPPGIIPFDPGFWNIRGIYKLKGLIDIGTQTSLVRLKSGKYVFLDAYTLTDSHKAWVDFVTEGEGIEAIINLHPFHTMHVKAMHEQFPNAKLYGTARHKARFADLSWEAPCTEEPEFWKLYEEDFAFTVPRGVDFVPSNENLHFASVLALHRASKTLHSDDTIVLLRFPGFIRWLFPDRVRFHPALAKVLQPRADAVSDFREWVRELLAMLDGVENLCAAHSAVLQGNRNEGGSIVRRVEEAFSLVEKKLSAHERRHT